MWCVLVLSKASHEGDSEVCSVWHVKQFCRSIGIVGSFRKARSMVEVDSKEEKPNMA